MKRRPSATVNKPAAIDLLGLEQRGCNFNRTFLKKVLWRQENSEIRKGGMRD